MDEEVKIQENIDINQALKEFEMKSQVEQAPKSSETLKASDVSRMVRLVMKLSGGAIKEKKVAEYVLLVLVVLMVSISLFLILSGRPVQHKLTPAAIEIINKMSGNR
jgi:hypothetical protein